MILDHLRAELGWLDLLVHRQVLRLRAAGTLNDSELRGLYISDDEVDALLADTRTATLAGDIRALDEQIVSTRSAIDAHVEHCVAAGIDLPLVRLSRLFGLSDFERHVALITAAPDLDLRYERLYAYVQNDVAKKRPQVDLALQLLCADECERWRARGVFSVDAPLRRNGLISLMEEGPLLTRTLAADDRIVAFLLDEPGAREERIASRISLGVRRSLDTLALPPAIRESLDRMATLPSDDGLTVALWGPPGVGKRAIAEALATAVDRPLLIADLADAPADTLALLVREARLTGAVLYLRRCEACLRTLAGLDGKALFVIVGTDERWPVHETFATGAVFGLGLSSPGYDAQVDAWRAALREAGADGVDDADIAAVAGAFDLTHGEIGAAVRRACAAGPAVTGDDLRRVVRDADVGAFSGLARLVRVTATWDDLVLPARTRRHLEDVRSAVRHRVYVHARWGFARRSAARGLNVLFAGASGTGKTMAARLLATDSGVNLYKVDLAGVVSKYIGETEKHLARVFAAARRTNAILLFDEADALFGKRSEVADAHDRYANLEVAYLLQQMEEHDGVVILTTNLRTNIDDAFTRRTQYIVDFPMPDAESRGRLWRSAFPSEAPVAANVDLAFLARQFELSGGHIANIALTAACLAADAGTPIEMRHCIAATARELQKLGRLPSRSDFREFYDWLR